MSNAENKWAKGNSTETVDYSRWKKQGFNGVTIRLSPDDKTIVFTHKSGKKVFAGDTKVTAIDYEIIEDASKGPNLKTRKRIRS